jgi:hypothetical protein
LSLPKVRGMTNSMKGSFDLLLIHPFDVIQHIAGLMGLTPLKGDLAIDQIDRRQKPFPSVHEISFRASPLSLR